MGNELEILLNNLIEGKYPFSSFLNSANGFATCLDFVNKNINNNGFHVFKIWLHNNKLISYLDYMHLKDLNVRLGLDIKIKEIPHAGFSLSLPNGDHLISLMTNQQTTRVNEFGLIQNISLNSNMFNYTNPILRMDPLSFATHFEIINNPASLPRSVRHNRINDIINDTWQGFRTSFETSLQINNLIRFNGAAGSYSQIPVGFVAEGRFDYYNNNFLEELPRLRRTFVREIL